MDHVDPDVLALIALGESDPAAEAHVAVCERCADEVAELARVVAVGRAAGPDDALVAPPARVWAAIESELGLTTAAPLPTTRAAAAAPAAEAAPDAEPRTGATTEPARPAPDDSDPAVVPLRRRRRTSAWIASAAAAGVVVGGLGGAWVASRDDAPAPAVLAQADLEALPGWDAVGHAEIEEDADGRRVLVLSVDESGGPGDTDGTDGLREVWLLKEDVSGLVSLGLLDGRDGRFLVPAGVDLAEFPVVDVSREPADGDPAHSGDSIVRGVLAQDAVGA